MIFFRIFHINPYKYEEMLVRISLEIIRNYRVFNWENQVNEWNKSIATFYYWRCMDDWCCNQYCMFIAQLKTQTTDVE